MADKKKIKNIKDNAGSGDGATITVVDITPVKAGAAPPADEIFDQGNYKALCFNVGDIINTESITIPGSAATAIIAARRIVRGTVLTVVNNNSGTIEENKSGKIINFHHPFLKELRIGVGSEVKYDLIPDLKSGGEIAVNVEILA